MTTGHGRRLTKSEISHIGSQGALVTGKPTAVRNPCDVCRRVHTGRCVPDDERSVRWCLTLPGRIDRRIRSLIPWGERSRWVADVVERELNRIEAR